MRLVWIRRLLVLALASIGLGACGSATTHRPDKSPQPRAGHVKWAHLSGIVEVCGNPMLQTAAHPGTNRCTLQAGHVSLLSAGRLLASARLVGGRFSFTVLPGAYTVIAWNSGNGPWTYDVSTKALHGKPLQIIIEAI